jgi:excisionase family DNA binding protein
MNTTSQGEGVTSHWEAVMQAEDLSTRYPEPWVGCGQVASHLDVSVKTVRRLKEAGLPYSKVGGQLRFRLSEVDAWIDRAGVA